jgi:hypothetical protein
MTAEVAIMNKTAIALAADSAVTSREKIYNTVNKLFRLSDHRSVGVMVYGSAEFMGVPWESLIKMHREALGTSSFARLKQYVDSFTTFLRAQHTRFPQSQREAYVRDLCWEHLATIREMVNDAIKLKGSDPPETVIRECIKTDCLGALTTKFKEIDGLPADARTRLAALFQPIFDEHFKDLPLPGDLITLLSQHCLEALCRLHFTDSSGIIIAGFGEDELFPALVELEFEGLAIDDVIKLRTIRETGVDFETPGLIVPFAQREMVDTFLTGAHPAYRKHLNSYLRKALKGYNAEIVKAIPALSPPERDDLAKKMNIAASEMVKQFREGITEFAQKTHIDPILAAVEMLPKDELAAMAESMINLTVLKRRVSTESETVGGPIDVAVISKGDGFIWIKRKHYFTKDLNPRYITQYFPVMQLSSS